MSCTAFTYAATAGAAGAFGAISAKFAFGEFSIDSEYEMFVLSVCIFVLSNVLMWHAYTKSLSLTDSTVQCLAVNVGTNFALTGILGCVLFSESHGMFWCFGLSLVFTGIYLLASGEKVKTH